MNSKINLFIISLLFTTILITSGCVTHKIDDIKNSDYVGRKVTVSGTVQNTIKLGPLSGFTIKDDTDTIGVSSDSLPAEGSEIRVTGTLVKDTILGYYIQKE